MAAISYTMSVVEMPDRATMQYLPPKVRTTREPTKVSLRERDIGANRYAGRCSAMTAEEIQSALRIMQPRIRELCKEFTADPRCAEDLKRLELEALVARQQWLEQALREVRRGIRAQP